MEKVKSFTFKVAKTADSNSKQLKAQNGVALAGCSLKELFPGAYDYACAQPAHGDGAWC